jgi:proteasome alpha subunit
VRPYGVSLLLAGVGTSGPRLFETDPSGAIFEYKATAIGSGKKGVEQFFENEYKDGMPMDEAIKLALKALKKVTEDKLSAQVIDVSIVESKSRKSRDLSADEVAKFLADAK